MNSNKNRHDDFVALPSERWSKRLARSLFPLIVAITTIQPLAHAAPNPSLLMQEPRFLDIAVQPNVIFMMDDSDSMNDTRLPLPSSIQLPQATIDSLLNPATNTSITRRAAGVSGTSFTTTAVAYPSVSWINEFAHRTHRLNPLYYNPAIRYRPWNDNRRLEIAPATNTFPDSDADADLLTGVGTNGFVAGRARHDMRYAGPNFTTASNNFTPLSTATGANPVYPTVSGSTANTTFGAPNRPANQGFQGQAAGGRNADIFSSPQVFVTTVVNQCIGGDFAIPGATLGTVAQTTNGRPFSAIDTGTRPNFPVNTVARPSTADLFEARNSFTIDSIPRPSVDANVTTRPNQPYSIGTRPNTLLATEARPSTPRLSTTRPMIYRWESGDCGSFTAWGPGPAPTPGVGLDGICSLGGEGATRNIVVQWDWGTCPTGTPSGGLCLQDCSSGWTAVGVTCWSDTCTTPTYGLVGSTTTATQCREPCPTGDIIGGRCYTACVGLQSEMVGLPAGATQCQTPCAGGNVIAGVCYLACTGAQVFVGTAATATQCSDPCAGALIAGQCYGNCTAPYANNGTQCTRSCAGTIGGGGTICYTDCPTAGYTPDPLNPAQCVSPCTTGNRIAGRCYTACLAPESELVGSAATATQCRTPCSGNIIGGSTCYTGCVSPRPQMVGAPATSTTCQSACAPPDLQSGGLCYTSCPSGTPDGTSCNLGCTNPLYPTPIAGGLCTESCPAPGSLVGNVCYACPVNHVQYSAPGSRCCPSANWVPVGTGCPAGQSCLNANTWYRDLNQPALARYYVFQPTTAIPSPTATDLTNSANYVLVEINRDRQHDFPKAPDRDDCPGSVCTWEQEAKNFANWYTYYRTRLFSAIAVTAQSLSNLTGGRDQIRLGYGSINYYPRGRDPYTTNDRYGNSLTVDGSDEHGGHIVRGVRPFTEVVPPPAPGGSNPRQEVFDWLFTLRGTGSTPNREALDAVGRYLTRDDDRGPWIQPNGLRRSGGGAIADGWSSSEQAIDHVPCRRNFMMLITDGEWTRNPESANPTQPRQPLVEAPNFPSRPATPLNALTTSGPTHTGPIAPAYAYTPATQPQFSTNANAAGGTLTDIALFWWSRDLRGATDPVTGSARSSQLQNNVPIDPATAASQGNPAFWQHLRPFIIGYGISATMNAATSSARSDIINSGLTPASPTVVNWPNVRLENRPTETNTIVTDQDVWDSVTRQPCLFDAQTSPSGCGRVNDTMRAALAARGNFLAAGDVGLLAQGIADAFSAIAERPGSATSAGGRSATIQANDRLFLAGFMSVRWTGQIESFNASAWFTAVKNGDPVPSTAPDRVVSNFPAPGSRAIFTSTDLTAPIAFPTGTAGTAPDFDLTVLTTAQRTALNNSAAVVRWLRGDQSTEAQNGGGLRNRPAGELMGDIINSTPVYSKATDFGYTSARKPNGAFGSSGNSYRDFVNNKRLHRPGTVIVGANGGMLHAFDASVAPSAAGYMQEKFAYVPRAMYPALEDLTSLGYVHRNYVDGQVTEGDIWSASTGWRNVVVTTSGAGPKSIFALDVTQLNPADNTQVQAFSASNVLWDIDPAVSTDPNRVHVGNIMANGVIASVPGASYQNKWYYLVGNGYESTNDKARLLAINMATGSIEYAIGPSGADDIGGNIPADSNRANRPNGLGGITPVYDANRNVVAVYAGDRLGRLFKFDLKNGLASATTTLLFDTDDSSFADLGSQPITAAPRITTHPLGGRFIVFGTGRFFERDDPENMDLQAVYGIREKNINSPARVTWAQLYGNSGGGLSLSEEVVDIDPSPTVTVERKFRILDNTAGLNWASHDGWFFNLRIGSANKGERVVVSPIDNFGFVNVTSYEPIGGGDRCKGNGNSYFYRLDIAGTFTRIPFAETGAITNLPSAVERTKVVGVDMAGMMGAPTLITGASQPFTGTAGTGLSSSTLTGLARERATATDPCAAMRLTGQTINNTAAASIPLTCVVPGLRVWRDLPGGPR